MKLFDFIGAIFKPAAELIDNIHTSDEERLTIQRQFFDTQTQAAIVFLEYESELNDLRGQVIMTETKSESWITRSWRPLTMLTFVAMVVAVFLGYTPENVSDDLVTRILDLIELGLMGYVVARSAEKIAPKIGEIFSPKETKP